MDNASSNLSNPVDSIEHWLYFTPTLARSVSILSRTHLLPLIGAEIQELLGEGLVWRDPETKWRAPWKA